MKKAYSFRIYPNKNQEVKLNRTLATCRKLYNDALSERKWQIELNRLYAEFQVFPWGIPEWITYEYQQNDLPLSKTPEQKEVYSQILQDVLRRLDKGFKKFFRGAGSPRFKGRNRYHSFTYSQKGFELKDGRLNLSKIGRIRIFLHREIEGKIKTCTIKKVPIKTKMGVDVGLIALLTLRNGEIIESPEFLRKSEKKLVWEQRKDFDDKTSRALVNAYDRVVFEKLPIQNMMQNHHLAKSIADAGWGQLCICGCHVPKTLSVRIHKCPECGLVIGRDHISAMLIENIDHVGTDCTEFTPGETEPLL